MLRSHRGAAQACVESRARGGAEIQESLADTKATAPAPQVVPLDAPSFEGTATGADLDSSADYEKDTRRHGVAQLPRPSGLRVVVRARKASSVRAAAGLSTGSTQDGGG